MRGFELICIFFLLLSGCGGDSSPETVFIVVNGVPITESQVRDSVLVQGKIRELSGHAVPEKDFAKWANTQAMRLIGPLANAELLQGEIKRRGVKPQDEDIQKTLESYNLQTGRGYKSVDELVEAFGQLGPVLRAEFEKTAATLAYTRQYWKAMVSDDMVQQYCCFRTNEMKRAVQINAEAEGKAAKAYARLKAGEAWDKVAADCSEDKFVGEKDAKYAEKWITVDEDAFRMKNLATLLPKMKEGDYTPPLDTRFGMLIIRLNKRDRQLHQLSRILFRMARDVKVPSAEEARKELSDQLFSQARERTLKRLEAEAKFEYPLGTNFTYRIWQEGE